MVVLQVAREVEAQEHVLNVAKRATYLENAQQEVIQEAVEDQEPVLNAGKKGTCLESALPAAMPVEEEIEPASSVEKKVTCHENALKAVEVDQEPALNAAKKAICLENVLKAVVVVPVPVLTVVRKDTCHESAHRKENLEWVEVEVVAQKLASTVAKKATCQGNAHSLGTKTVVVEEEAVAEALTINLALLDKISKWMTQQVVLWIIMMQEKAGAPHLALKIGIPLQNRLLLEMLEDGVAPTTKIRLSKIRPLKTKVDGLLQLLKKVKQL